MAKIQALVRRGAQYDSVVIRIDANKHRLQQSDLLTPEAHYVRALDFLIAARAESDFTSKTVLGEVYALIPRGTRADDTEFRPRSPKAPFSSSAATSPSWKKSKTARIHNLSAGISQGIGRGTHDHCDALGAEVGRIYYSDHSVIINPIAWRGAYALGVEKIVPNRQASAVCENLERFGCKENRL